MFICTRVVTALWTGAAVMKLPCLTIVQKHTHAHTCSSIHAHTLMLAHGLQYTKRSPYQGQMPLRGK